MRRSFLPLFILLLPFAEIAGFIVVGQWIGLWATLGLIAATSFLGALLLRIQGVGILRKISLESRDGRVPGKDLIHAAMIVIAGFLLLLPGFITDIAGLALFLPFVRELVWKHLSARIVVMGSSSRFDRSRPFSGAGRSDDGRVVDLDSQDFHREPDPGSSRSSSPWSGKHRLGD